MAKEKPISMSQNCEAGVLFNWPEITCVTIQDSFKVDVLEVKLFVSDQIYRPLN